MSYTLSPNMNLLVPTVGSQPGPDYASNINTSLALVDSHDHTPGKGVQIVSAALNINANLSFNNHAITNLASLTFVAQATPPPASSLYQAGVDLVYIDGNGTSIPITAGGAIAGAPGSITGMSPPAGVVYVSASKTFFFQSDTTTPFAASLDAGSVSFRNITPNSTNAITVSAPAALTANYNLTLPLNPVSGTYFTTLTSAGVLAPTINTAAGITGANIAAATIAASNLIATVRQQQKQIFTSNGTFTTPSDTSASTVYKITCVGAGGGGACWTLGAGGGGGGATSITWASGYAAASTFTVTIGTGGAGATVNQTNGVDGGDTTFGSICTAKGGKAGHASGGLIYGGSGGLASAGVGDLKLGGGSGEGGVSGSLTSAQVGCGGSSTFGGGGQGANNNAPLAAQAGQSYGGGGGAGWFAGSQFGAAGANGVVIVEWVQ